MKIDVHENVCTPKIKGVIPIVMWLGEIKEAKKYGPTIELARRHGKGSKEYDQIKTYKLPAVNFNYQFNEKLCLANATAPTGVFYVDIDFGSKEEAIQYKENLRENQFVYSSWLSLSELGLGVLVRSSIVTPENFSDLHRQFCEQFEIPYDKRAVKLNQYNVLSHDPDIYLNKYAIDFNPEIKPIETGKKKKVQSLANQGQEQEKQHIATNCTFFRYNNLSNYWKPNDVVVSEEGFQVTELFLPLSIPIGKRKHTLLAFANNLVVLNPTATKEAIYTQIEKKNVRCTPPLDSKELWDIVHSVFKYKDAGTLKALRTRNRKIIFGPHCGMNKSEKREFVNAQIGEWRKDKTKQKIYEAIENWNRLLQGKITAKSVKDATGLSLRTVKTYWAEFKSYVSELNKSESTKAPIQLCINAVPNLTQAELTLTKLKERILSLKHEVNSNLEIVLHMRKAG